MKTIEGPYTDTGLVEDPYYAKALEQPFFASRLQLFAVIVYVLSQGFTIPILPIGPSWAVWPRLDDFATAFLVTVYLFTRANIRPMNKLERTISALIIGGAVLSLPSTAIGVIIHPETIKGTSYGIFQTYRTVEYFMVWYCIRGMTFSSRQFDKISYAVFFVVVFVVIIALGNATGAIPPARLLTHLPYEGPWGELKRYATRAGIPRGPYGWNPGDMVDQLVFLTMILLASRRPLAVFRIPLMVVVAGVIFLTGSRAATLAWCLALIIWAHKSIKQLIIMLIVVSLLFVFLYMFSSSFEYKVVERATYRVGTLIHREEDPTMSGRTVQWEAALRYIASHPGALVIGAGWGFSGHVLTPETGVVYAHSMYLDVLLEVGIFGAVMYYILLFNLYRLLQGKDRLLAALRAGFLALLVAGITGSVFYPIAGGGSFLGFVGAVFGIGTATYRGRLLEEQLYSEYEPSEEGDFSYEYSV
jgi:hypothetical protein